MKMKSDRGFTLVELLTVIAIIAVLAALTVGASKYALRKAAETRAIAEIHTIETKLEDFKADNGYYPNSTELRGNATANSILLYNALAGGTKRYFALKPEQIRDGRNTINISFVCPTTNYSVLVTNVAIIDPFGRPYVYFRNPCGTGNQTNAVTFDLWSYGPNGIDDGGTNDDVTNWQMH